MGEQTAPYAGWWRRDGPAIALLAVAGVASAIVLLALQTDLTFRLDDWAFLLYRRVENTGAGSVLSPHNEHIVVLPVLVYKALLATFGADSARPFQVVATLLFLAGAAALFVYLRRRVGGWLALAGVLPVLFLGTSAEDLLWQFQIGFLGTLAAGVGALLALDRDDRRGDVLGCALLTIAVGFSSLWLAFAVAAAVIVGWDARRWRRAYVVAIPAAVYAIWWVWWGQDAESSFALHRLADVPGYVAEGLASSAASWTGIGQHQDDLTISNTLLGGAVLGVALIAAAWRVAAAGISRSLVAVCAAALAFWAAAGANATLPGREADVSRYQLIGVVLGLLVAAEVLRGVRPAPRITAAVLAVAVAATVSNAASLVRYADGLEGPTRIERADLAALELARGSVAEDFELTPEVAETALTVGVRADLYFDLVDDYGSPAVSEPELPGLPAAARVAADRVLASALALEVDPETELRPGRGPPPELVGSGAARASERGSCLTARAAGEWPLVVRLPAGGVLVSARGPGAPRLGLRRFATDGFPIDARGAAAGGRAAIVIPADSSSVPWELGVRSQSLVKVCALR